MTIMRISRQILSATLSIAIALTILTSTASAADAPFADVAASHPYAQEIWKAQEMDITTGTGAGCFAPDRALTLWEMCVFLCRAYLPDEEPGIQTAMRWHQLTPLTDYAEEENKPVIWGFFTDALLRAGGVHVWNDQLFDTEKEKEVNSSPSRRAAAALGLLDLEKQNTFITRAEAVTAIIKLKETDKKLPEPPILSEFPITVKQYVMGCDQALLDIQSHTEYLREQFISRGWKIVLDTEYLAKYNEMHGTAGVGLCESKTKTIYLAEGSSLHHELGHFIDLATGYPDAFDRAYIAEAQGLAKLQGQYCTTSRYEFVADAVDYWMCHFNEPDRLRHLEENCPIAYQQLQEWAADGWLPEAAPTY